LWEAFFETSFCWILGTPLNISCEKTWVPDEFPSLGKVLCIVLSRFGGNLLQEYAVASVQWQKRHVTETFAI
jgi:hypothetical protein